MELFRDSEFPSLMNTGIRSVGVIIVVGTVCLLCFAEDSYHRFHFTRLEIETAFI